MAATAKKQIWFYSSDDGVAPSTETVQIAATQGLPIVGSPMVLAADGYWDLVADNATKIHGFLAETINTQKSAGDEIRIFRADPKYKYAVYCESTGTDSAVVQANVGVSYAITVSASAGEVGYTTCDLGDTGNDAFQIVDLMFNVEPQKYALADSPGVAIVRIVSAVIAPS